MSDCTTINKDQANYMAPFLTMVFLFLIVGFLTTANTQFQGPLKALLLSDLEGMQNTFSTLITFSWFLAYPLCGGIGTRWINKAGYRSTLVRGLVVMVAGLGLTYLSSYSAVNYPEAGIPMGQHMIPGAFILFLLGSFVTGASATILQVVINPYLTACTVPGTQAVQRLAIGGSANAIGTTVAPFFVTYVVFGGLAMDDISVDSIMTPFLLLMAVIAAVAVGLKNLALPDIASARDAGDKKLPDSVWSFSHLTLGVIAIFFYVGAEVCIGANINMYAIERNLASPALLATLYWGGILVGRLVGSTLSKVPPRTQLTVTTICATLLTALAVALSDPWMLAGVGLFHSIMWGCIFTLAVAHLGKYTAAASGVFMIGVVGGAIMPLLQGVMADAMGGWRMSWLIVIFCELFMLYYARIGSKVKKTAD